MVKRPECFKFIVEENLEKIIRHICARYPDNEFSGTLFYTVEGDFEDGSLVVRGKDFYVQDIGESTYTEFQNDVTLASYMVEHELWGCYTGLMHSHNRMQTFFSGTDINTLYSEGDEQNHFVSLIINNAGSYNAAITRKVKGERKTVTTGTESLTYKSFNNVEKVINSQPFRSEATQEVYRLEYYMMNVEIETNVSYERNPLDIRLDELQASSKSYINKYKYGGNSYPGYSSGKTYNFPIVTQNKPAAPIQTTLFDDYKDLDPDEIAESVENGIIDYDKVHIEKHIMMSHIRQLITLNLMAGANPNIDLRQWDNNMEKALDKRFIKDNEDALKNYEYVIDSFVDILSSELNESNLYKFGDEFCQAIWSNDISNYIFGNFKINKYIEVIIKSLKRCLI